MSASRTTQPYLSPASRLPMAAQGSSTDAIVSTALAVELAASTSTGQIATQPHAALGVRMRVGNDFGDLVQGESGAHQQAVAYWMAHFAHYLEIVYLMSQ